MTMPDPFQQLTESDLRTLAAALCGLAVLGPALTSAQDKPKEEPKVTTTKSGLKYTDEKDAH